jgi:hypothetical protein
MTAPAPPEPADPARLAEKIGEISRGVAADGGGDRLSRLLISILDLIIQALLSLRWDTKATIAPTAAQPTPAPQQPASEPDPHQAARPPRPREPRRQAGKGPVPPRASAGQQTGVGGARGAAEPRNRSPDDAKPDHRARLPAAPNWPRATAPPGKPSKNRPSAAAAFGRPICYVYGTISSAAPAIRYRAGGTTPPRRPRSPRDRPLHARPADPHPCR